LYWANLRNKFREQANEFLQQAFDRAFSGDTLVVFGAPQNFSKTRVARTFAIGRIVGVYDMLSGEPIETPCPTSRLRMKGTIGSVNSMSPKMPGRSSKVTSWSGRPSSRPVSPIGIPRNLLPA